MTCALDLHPVLDLASTYDPASSDGGRVHHARSVLARQIVAYAAQCRNNAELLNGLQLAFDPAYGFEPLQVIGAGSTRRVWTLPFDLVLKLERRDDLTAPEMEYRGSRNYLYTRRRASTFNEMLVSTAFPALGPRIYGFLPLGKYRLHPAVLICERADLRGRRQTESVSVNDLFLSGDAGELLLTDRAMNPDAAPAKPSDKPFRQIFRGGDDSIHFSNFGRIDGRWVLLDLGNYYSPSVLSRLAQLDHWEPSQLSQVMLERYEQERRALFMGGSQPDTGGYGDE